MEKYAEIFEKIGFEISDEKILREAFTHKSASNEKKNRPHNERLEFLGDAVLELVATDFLFQKFPDAPEGKLTSFRSALVKGDHLAEVAKKLKFGKFLILSRGEASSGGRKKNYLLANVLEAFIGAIYLHKNFLTARKFIKKFILCDLEKILKENAHIDAKSEFQEIAQEKFRITPHYEVLEESGPDHQKNFLVAVFLDKKKYGTGSGSSKKDGQSAAAAAALKKIKK